MFRGSRRLIVDVFVGRGRNDWVLVLGLDKYIPAYTKFVINIIGRLNV